MVTVTTSVLDTSSVVPPRPAAPASAGGFGGRAVERAGLTALLIATAVLYLWNITINGMGNQFYAGAAWAGSKSWEALLFGSLDPANFITVDKPPVSQWVMGLSGRIFGFSSASMLIPQALMAVAAVALLYGAVRRVSNSHHAGLLAGAALALTPVAALMFRFNNPDAVMVLLMMAAAYATVRALQHASTLWIVLAGAALGFAFLAKMLEGLMVLPALGLAYLIAAPNPIRTRIVQLFGALVALLVASGWYVLVTLWWPASSRPYLAGSTDNNFMNLVLGYNGFARVLGRNHGGGGGGHAQTPPAHAAAQLPAGHPGFGGFGGQVRGVERLFSGEFGVEIGWLLPAALLAFVLVLISRGRAPRTDLMRAAAIVFGGWMIIDGAVLSYMNGMVHPYYCLSIAPAVAGMFALGIREMWTRRETLFGRLGAAALLAVTGVWSFVLLQRNSGWYPELRWAILIVTLLAAVLVAIPWTHRAHRRFAAAVLTVGLLGGLSGAAAYSVATVATAHSGGGPTVGPAQADGHGDWGQAQANPQLTALLQKTNSTWAAAVNGSSSAAGLELQSGKAVMAIGGFSGSDPTPTLAEFQADVKAGKIGYYVVQSNGRGQGNGSFDSRTDTTGTADRSATGGARTQRSQTADPARMPGGSGGFGRNQHTDITNWVTATFTPQQVGNATVYNLSGYLG
ncbi:ArnT family glycosyltransferase [Nocardia jiangxiensis]|uniref:ArnT family glycosyltransferase n=1 Tax=Nocardia jiangxiensis TaxID=282685 RepID=UPI0002FA0F44|nr:glycosyltransferase family 39 protein [Nocardia jiangxiensis]